MIIYRNRPWVGNCPEHGEWVNWCENECVYEVWKEENDKKTKAKQGYGRQFIPDYYKKKIQSDVRNMPNDIQPPSRPPYQQTLLSDEMGHD